MIKGWQDPIFWDRCPSSSYYYHLCWCLAVIPKSVGQPAAGGSGWVGLPKISPTGNDMAPWNGHPSQPASQPGQPSRPARPGQSRPK